eukprot:3676580-Rhodomonas_salina.3
MSQSAATSWRAPRTTRHRATNTHAPRKTWLSPTCPRAGLCKIRLVRSLQVANVVRALGLGRGR